MSVWFSVYYPPPGGIMFSAVPSVRPSVTIYPTHFVDTTSTLLGGRIETGLDSYESQDIEPWPRQGHVSIAPKTRLWRDFKVDQKIYFSHRLNMGELSMGENTRFNHIKCWN